MIRPRIAPHLRRRRAQVEPDILQLSQTVVPVPGASSASMRFLEFAIASIALVVAIVLGLGH